MNRQTIDFYEGKMQNFEKYLKQTRNINVVLKNITPVREDNNNNLVLYNFDRTSYQTTFLVEQDGKFEVARDKATNNKLKLINKGGSFSNNPFVAPKIPDDMLKSIGEGIFKDERHYDRFDRETIYITEGLEDCLTIRQITGCETWAVIGFWNFRFDSEKLNVELLQKLTERQCICVMDKVDFTNKQQFENHSKIIENHYKINDYKINYVMVQHDTYKDTNDYLRANEYEELTELLLEEGSLNPDQLLKLFNINNEENQNTTDIGLITDNIIFVKKSKENQKILENLGLPSSSIEQHLMLDNSKHKFKIFKTPVDMMKYLECWDYFDGWKDLTTSTPFICFRNSKGEREYYKKLKNSKLVDENLVGEIFINETNELEKVYFNQTWKHILFLDSQKNLHRVKDYFFDYIFNGKIGASCHFLKDFSRNKGFCESEGRISYNISDKLNLGKLWEKIKSETEEGDFAEEFQLYQDFIFQVVCNEDQNQADWLHNWIASAVQDPLKEKWHCKTSLYFNSIENSTGKTLLAVNIIGMLLSGNLVENCPCNVAKMSNRDWSDKFSYQELNNKLLCVCNELGGGANFYEMIKDIIDSPTIKIERKFKDTYKIKNTCRFIFTTNENKLPIKEQDVRIAIFKFSEKWLGTENMNKLAKLFDTRTFDYRFCKYLFNSYLKIKVDPNLIKDSYKSKERQNIINENFNEIESAINDIKDLNIDIYETYKYIKGSSSDLPFAICLKDVSRAQDGFCFVKSTDLLQYLKKAYRIYKSTKAFSQILVNNGVEFIEHRGYRYFKVSKDD